MSKTYNAVYYNSQGRFYNATIFLSSITLSIRFVDENNQSNDVYWLAEDIVSIEEQLSASVLQYKNREGRAERLVIRDPELLQAIKKHFSHHRFAGGWKHHLLGNTRNKLFLAFSVLIALILAGYFWFVPWLGERIADNISKDWEISMGKKMNESILSQYKVDTNRTHLINLFFKELYYDIHYPVTITVVDSKELNAFAVPGGPIVVYRAILEKMSKPEELAALLSHEASHIELRHSLKNIFRSMARKMFLMMIVGNESGLAGFLVDNADNLKGLEYSRSLETEADNHGISLMNTAKIDPVGMIGLIEILQEETKEKEPSAFLSTHPVFKKRIENIKRQLEKSPTEAGTNERLESIFANLKNSSGTLDW